MANLIKLFCLIHGDDPVQRAFPIQVAKTATIGELKEQIKAKKTPEFDNLVADKLTLWKVIIPNDELAKTHRYFDIEVKGIELSPLQRLYKVFSEEPMEEHVHIVVQIPPVFKSVAINASFERKVAKFVWKEQRRYMTFTGLRSLVYQVFKFPDGVDESDVTIKASFDPDGLYMPIDNDETLAKLVGNDDGDVQLSLVLGTLQQPYSSYTFKNMARIMGIPEERYNDLPTFKIGIVEIDQKILDNTVEEIMRRWRGCFNTQDANEATLKMFIVCVLFGVIEHYGGQLRIVAEHEIAGTNGRGPVDFAIIRRIGFMIAGITEGKKLNVNNGVGQNAVQLQSALYNNKKRSHDDMDGENSLYGIVSTGARWVITKMVERNGKAVLMVSDTMDLYLPIGERELTAAKLREDLEPLMQRIKWCFDQQLPQENNKRVRRVSPPSRSSSRIAEKRASSRSKSRSRSPLQQK